MAEIDLTTKKMSDKEKLAHFIGRSGKMRAPVIVTGKTIIAGFDEKIYKDCLI